VSTTHPTGVGAVHGQRRDGFDIVTAETVLPTGDPERVWKRITSPAGINAELAPLLRMRMPKNLAADTLDDVELNTALGRAWVLLLGFLPVDFDNLRLVERTTGHRFLERSTTSSSRVWQHERVVTADTGGVRVRDQVTYAVRAPLRPLRRPYLAVVTALFRHRHRRLWAAYGAAPTP
jgi:ligand-binding SRPBCC domain-containing protein